MVLTHISLHFICCFISYAFLYDLEFEGCTLIEVDLQGTLTTYFVLLHHRLYQVLPQSSKHKCISIQWCVHRDMLRRQNNASFFSVEHLFISVHLDFYSFRWLVFRVLEVRLVRSTQGVFWGQPRASVASWSSPHRVCPDDGNKFWCHMHSLNHSTGDSEAMGCIIEYVADG